MNWNKITHWTDLMKYGPVLVYSDREIYSLHSINGDTRMCEVIDIRRPHTEFRKMYAGEFTHFAIITPPKGFAL